MMRKLDNTDFETSNIEYIEFWMMDPFLTNPNPTYEGGDLYFNLGDISEDILKDGKKSFEHGLPVSGDDVSTLETTVWGRVPKTSSTVIAFSNESGARRNQDVGLNGLSTENEFTFDTYADYESRLRSKVTDPETVARWNQDPFSPFNDPAGDNYHFYRGSDYDRERKSIIERYRYFNGTEGNSPATENSAESYGTASTLEPDIEDINKDNTLNEYEKFYEYKVEIRRGKMEVGQNFITDKITSKVKLANGQTTEVTGNSSRFLFGSNRSAMAISVISRVSVSCACSSQVSAKKHTCALPHWTLCAVSGADTLKTSCRQVLQQPPKDNSPCKRSTMRKTLPRAL
jgi:cell surface protein SprA